MTEFSKSIEQDMTLFIRRFHLPNRADGMLRQLMERAYQAGQEAAVDNPPEVPYLDVAPTDQPDDREITDFDNSLGFGEGAA